MQCLIFDIFGFLGIHSNLKILEKFYFSPWTILENFMNLLINILHA